MKICCMMGCLFPRVFLSKTGGCELPSKKRMVSHYDQKNIISMAEADC